MSSKNKSSDSHLKIQQNGWKQFSIIDYENNTPPDGVPDGMYILVSQDCDIVNFCFVKESKVEIIRVTERSKPDKALTGLKNFRKAQVPFDEGGTEKYYEIDINHRYFIRRELLSDISPVPGIIFNDIAKQIIIRVLFARYERIALPDTFNDRFPKNEIKKLLEDYKNDVFALFLKITPSEEEMPLYKVHIIMLVTDTERHDELLEQIVDKINECSGIEVENDYRSLTIDEMTVRQYTEYQAYWHFTELSFQGEEVGPTI